MAIRRLTNRTPDKYHERRTRRPGKLIVPSSLRRLRFRLVPITLGLLGFSFLASATIVLWWSRDLPDPQKINSRQVIQSTKIYDRTGTHLLYEIGEVRRTTVSLDRISKHLINATVTAEDDQFFEHHGIDLKGIVRGVILKPLSGSRAQGGSTITQQLIKNSILTPERTIRRKVKEAVLAMELEQRLSKEEILAMYLNEIPYGSQSYGVEAASQTLFGRSAADLTLAQATIIAALPKAPTYYSPYGSHFEDLKIRQESILHRMVNLKFINEQEAEQAKQEPLDFRPRAEAISAPHFVFYVKQQLDQEYGERVVEQGGLVVTTTLDMRLQTIAEDTLKKQQEKLQGQGASNAALVAIDPKNGDILAMAGSVDYFNEEIDGNVNVAIRHRSPGSSIKPFVYAAAWKKGYTPETILIDAETDFGQGYQPKNYNLSERGPVSMRFALANSLNIPAVKTLYLAGVKEATDLAQAMGMPSLNDPDRYGLSLVLGGGEVTLLDEVSAYGVFANDGVRQPHRAILKTADNKEILFDATKDELMGQQVITAQLSRTVSNVLSDNPTRSATFGANNYLNLGSRPVAAKTGTTQDFRDGWTLGYTPSLVAGVWTGNNDNSPMGKHSDGSLTAAPIWNAFFKQALEGTPIETFVPPEPTKNVPHAILRGEIPEVKGKWDPDSNVVYSLDCPVAIGRPTTFKEIHSILFYISRAHPLGAAPSNAENDGQFKHWEEGVAKWRLKHNAESKDKPEEPQYTDSLPILECGTHNAEDLPKVSIIEPNTTVLTDSPTTIKAEVDSPKKIKEVHFLIDGQKVAVRKPSDPLTVDLTFESSFSGRKTLLIMAITEDNLIGRAHRTFIINPDDSPPSVTLHTPTSGSTLKATNFPLTAKVTANDSSGIDIVDVLYTKEGDSGTKRIGRTTNPHSTIPNRYEIIWPDSPGPGTYTVFATAYDKTGNTTESTKHTITID
jgi:1A family penicillin-binding protein